VNSFDLDEPSALKRVHRGGSAFALTRIAKQLCRGRAGHHFNIGLMGAAEARRKRFLLNGDLLWIRISDSHALPFPGLGATSADVRAGQLVWTSKLGYRSFLWERGR
jgi:hypothetical protein